MAEADDPHAAIQELAHACEPFVDVHNRAGWVSNAYAVGRPDYIEHMEKTAPSLRP